MIWRVLRVGFTGCGLHTMDVNAVRVRVEMPKFGGQSVACPHAVSLRCIHGDTLAMSRSVRWVLEEFLQFIEQGFLVLGGETDEIFLNAF